MREGHMHLQSNPKILTAETSDDMQSITFSKGRYQICMKGRTLSVLNLQGKATQSPLMLLQMQYFTILIAKSLFLTPALYLNVGLSQQKVTSKARFWTRVQPGWSGSAQQSSLLWNPSFKLPSWVALQSVG